MKTAVIQVLGDIRGYRRARYLIKEREYRERISAFAIRNWLEDIGKDCRIIFIVPESIITRIEEDRDEAFEILKNRARFGRRILDLIGGDAEIELIPSVGVYTGRYTVRFDGSIENSVVQVFRKLVEEEFDEIYADVSTGQNVYVASVIEALRSYAVYRKLGRILEGDEKTEISMIYVPPVLVEDQDALVEMHELEVRAFFDLPAVNPKDVCLDQDKRREISRKYREFFDEFSRCYKTLKIAFNAIKYNTPLVFYHPDILDLDIDTESLEEKFLGLIRDLEMSREVIFEDEILKVIYVPFKSRNVINVLFSISMLRGIVDFWREKIRGKEPEISEILKTFDELYRNLRLEVNSKFLERDVREIEDRSRDLKSEKPLIDLYLTDESGKGREGKSGDAKRNFFAHSGFLREITVVKRTGDKVIAKYDIESIRRSRHIDVVKWLLNP